jgi:hypothetical protein
MLLHHQLKQKNHDNNITSCHNNSDPNLDRIPTATNITHSFAQRSDTNNNFQHPYWDTVTVYTQSIPPYLHHPLSMALTHHTQLKPNNKLAAPISNIEINPNHPAFTNVNNSQLT